MKKIILFTLTLILTACSFGAKSEFDHNRQTWKDAGVTHYQFSLDIMCFCPFRGQMPITIEVQNDQIVSITALDGTLITASDPDYSTYIGHGTIDLLFSELEAGLSGNADEVTVTYDPEYGFPNKIYFDFIKAAADDELTLTVSNFEVLK